MNDQEMCNCMSNAALRKIYRDLLVRPIVGSSATDGEKWLRAFDLDLENYVKCRIRERLVEMGVDSGCDVREADNG